ncbi:ATP-binding protein [Streptomyces sp. LS1784]|uniref:ATP-binding protein n=1 Tax=Streptomyces sp. LS1784 TaxID=2851533 RepID=UPI001CCF1921|nr:ATP-binding protein [Streptomyces sp. LS1784]
MKRSRIPCRPQGPLGDQPGRSPRPATARLPYLPESASTARELIREKLREWELPQVIDAAELIVSELVANAVKTGCLTHMTVSVRRVTDGTVRVAVRDGSRVLPTLLVAGDEDEGHRGLALVDHLTRGRWGAVAEQFGKVVHADLVVTAVAP